MTAPAPPATDAATRALLDRMALREVAECYFSSLDRRDWAALQTCFAADARYEMFNGRLALKGRDQILGRLREVSRFTETSHAASNMAFTLSGDKATGDIFAIAHCVVGPREGGRVRVRGIRYLDEYRHEPGGWRIIARQHLPLWQYDADTVGLMPPKE